MFSPALITRAKVSPPGTVVGMGVAVRLGTVGIGVAVDVLATVGVTGTVGVSVAVLKVNAVEALRTLSSE